MLNAGFSYEKINFIYTHTQTVSPLCVYIFCILPHHLFKLPQTALFLSHSLTNVHIHVRTLTHTYTSIHILLLVTQTDCRAPELMKCQAQTPPPPLIRTKIIITVSRALSHFICSTHGYSRTHSHLYVEYTGDIAPTK